MSGGGGSAEEAEENARRKRFGHIVAGLNAQLPLAERGRDPRRVVVEAVELGGVEAERLVAAGGGTRRRSGRGRCHVSISFADPKLLAVFVEVGAVVQTGRSTWELVRRWAEAGSHARLDEDMCLAVARRLHRTFGWRLRTRVLAIYD